MALLPRTERGARQYTAPMVDVSVGQRAAAATIGDAIGVIDGIGEIAKRETYKKAELDGQVAGSAAGNQRDENGNLLPLTGLPDPGTAYGRAYANAAISNYSVSAQTDAGLKANALMDQFKNDPETLRTKWNEYQTATLKALDPVVASELESHFVRIGGDAYGKAVTYKRELVRKETIDNLENVGEATLNSIYNVADEMGWSSGGMVERASDMLGEYRKTLLQIQGANPEFTNGMIDRTMQEAQRNILTRAATSEAWKIASGSRVNIDKALKWLDGLVENPPEEFASLFSPQQLIQLRQQGAAWVSAKDNEENISQSLSRQANSIAAIGKVGAMKEQIDSTSTASELNKLLQGVPTMKFSSDPVENARARVSFNDQISTKLANLAKSGTDAAIEVNMRQKLHMLDQMSPTQLGEQVTAIHDGSSDLVFSSDAEQNEKMKTQYVNYAQNRLEAWAREGVKDAKIEDLLNNSPNGFSDGSQERAAVDHFVDNAFGQGADMTPFTEEGTSNLMAVADKFNIVGQNTVDTFNSIGSGRASVEQTVAAAQAFLRISQQAPLVAGQVDSVTKQYLTDVASQYQFDPNKPEDAKRFADAKRTGFTEPTAQNARMRAWQDSVKANPNLYDEHLANASKAAEDARGLFGDEKTPGYGLMSPPSLLESVSRTVGMGGPAIPALSDPFVRDAFKTLMDKHMMTSTNPDDAAAKAMNDLSSVSGVSEFSGKGEPTVELYAIEKVFPDLSKQQITDSLAESILESFRAPGDQLRDTAGTLKVGYGFPWGAIVKDGELTEGDIRTLVENGEVWVTPNHQVFQQGRRGYDVWKQQEGDYTPVQINLPQETFVPYAMTNRMRENTKDWARWLNENVQPAGHAPMMWAAQSMYSLGGGVKDVYDQQMGVFSREWNNFKNYLREQGF